MFTEFMLPGVPPAAFWTLAALAIVIQGVSKSGFAGGAGILSLPLMMLVMPVDKVAATLLPLLILCDMNAIYHHRRNKDWRVIRRIYFPALAGIAAGGFVWWWAGQHGIEQYGAAIKRFAGCIAIAFGLYIAARERSMAWAASRRPGRAAAWAAGLSAGFASTLAHAAGPIVSLFVYAQSPGKSLFVGTVAWTFTLINLTKVPFYMGAGLLHWDVLQFGALLVPCIPLGSWLGHWMHHRVDERRFNRVIMALTLIAGVQLLTGLNLVLLALAPFAP